MKKYFIAGTLAVSMLLPFLTGAVSVDELQAQIKVLMAQVATLQVQLNTRQGASSTTPWCYTFNKNLKIWEISDEVYSLRTALGMSGYTVLLTERAQPLYNDSFASAVTAFQEKYKSEVLTPVGLSHGTGYVGPSTRKKLNQLYGCGNVDISSEPLPTWSPTPNPLASPKPISTVLSGSDDTILILLKFPNSTSTSFTSGYANDLVFGDGQNSLKTYLKEVSYGKYNLVGQTYGWLTMPYPIESYCRSASPQNRADCNYGPFSRKNFANRDLESDAIQAAIKVGLDIQKARHIILVFDAPLGTCPSFSTVGVLDTSVANGPNGEFLNGGIMFKASVVWINKEDFLGNNHNSSSFYSSYVLAHEFGHSLGALHAGSWKCGSNLVGADLSDINNGCTYEEYGDGQDPMGEHSLRHYSAIAKEEIGFLSPNQTLIASHDGEYQLDQFEYPSSGYKQIKIALGKGYFYSLEYRTKKGYDALDLGSNFEPPIEGVLVRLQVPLVSETVNRSLGSLRPYTPAPYVLYQGDSFRDPFRKVEIAFAEKQNDFVKLKITNIQQNIEAPTLINILQVLNAYQNGWRQLLYLQSGVKNVALNKFQLTNLKPVSGNDLLTLQTMQLVCSRCYQNNHYLFTNLNLYEGDTLVARGVERLVNSNESISRIGMPPVDQMSVIEFTFINATTLKPQETKYLTVKGDVTDYLDNFPRVQNYDTIAYLNETMTTGYLNGNLVQSDPFSYPPPKFFLPKLSNPASSNDGKLIVLSPNGGESLPIGSSVRFSWAGGDSSWGLNLLLINEAYNYNKILAQNVPNSGNVTLSIPTDLIPGNYSFRVACQSCSSIMPLFDDSDDYFSITAK